jgi:hypothetical protein
MTVSHDRIPQGQDDFRGNSHFFKNCQFWSFQRKIEVFDTKEQIPFHKRVIHKLVALFLAAIM